MAAHIITRFTLYDRAKEIFDIRFWVSALAILALLKVSAVRAEEIGVPDDYSTIQAAIDAAVAGDTIIVEPGDYTESIRLRSEIDVRGREAARTMLSAGSVSPVVQISNVNDSIFANFTIVDSSAAIAAENSNNITIASNIFDTLAQTAITIDGSSSLEIVNNVFWGNATAIQRATEDATVRNNIFAANVQTIVSPSINPIDANLNVEFNCFFDNSDLRQGDIDTALGTSFQIGDPLFVDIASRDFHLQRDSPCIDAGSGTDIIDNTVADTGAYGGDYADPRPFPVPQPVIRDASAIPPPSFNIELSWTRNLSYLVTNSANPGGYRVHYRLNQMGPPYDGQDAGGGTQPSPIDVGDGASFTLRDLQPSIAAPIRPQLLSAEPRNAAVILSWTRVEGVQGYRVYYGVAAVDENQIDVGNVEAFTIGGLQNGSVYRFAVASLARPIYFLAITVLDNTQNRNESVLSEAQSLRIGPLTESTLSSELNSTPQEILAFPELPDNGCFIATAAYSSDWAAEVRLLRDFRDRYLLTNRPGRWFVRWYYANSPPAARYLEAHPRVKPLVRALLLPMVAMAALMLERSWSASALLCVLVLVLVLLMLQRGRARTVKIGPAPAL